MKPMPESRAVWVVVVARIGNGAKSRLAVTLSAAQRRQLALAMLTDVLDVCGQAQARGVIDGTVAVVDELDARLVVEHAGAIAVADPGASDMNAAVLAGLRAARARGAATAVIVPGDVPLIGVADFVSLLEVAGSAPRAVILGASHDGVGTNALVVRPLDVIVPAFGPPSLRRHERAGLSAGALTRVQSGLGLALDIDTPGDLALLPTAHPGLRIDAGGSRTIVHGRHTLVALQMILAPAVH
jgi:2-phospho-L-lactate/phosphoenolpyruvate guanylyltransferase